MVEIDAAPGSGAEVHCVTNGDHSVTQVDKSATNNNIVQMIQVSGWPEKWGEAPAPPRPFDPPGFELTPAMLERAFAKCRIGEPEPAAIARLYAALLEDLHADPHERNMYLSPKRADQALVYLPERWQLRGLKNAVGAAFDGISAQMECAGVFAPHLHAQVADARKGFAAHREQVLRTSCAPLAAHLENLRAGEGVWLCGAAGTAGQSGLARGFARELFGNEFNGHLPPAAIATALESALGLYGPADWPHLDAAETARRAVFVFARQMLGGRPGNLTVAADPADAGGVRIFTAAGWQAVPAAEAAGRLFGRMAALLRKYLGVVAGSAAVRETWEPLTAHLVAHGDALIAREEREQELLAHYVRAESHHRAAQQP